jgi:hypothetical protein
VQLWLGTELSMDKVSWFAQVRQLKKDAASPEVCKHPNYQEAR